MIGAAGNRTRRRDRLNLQKCRRWVREKTRKYARQPAETWHMLMASTSFSHLESVTVSAETPLFERRRAGVIAVGTRWENRASRHAGEEPGPKPPRCPDRP